MRTILMLSGAGLALLVLPAAVQAAGPDYANTSLPFEKRAADYVAHMTLEEKASQVGMWDQTGIDHLGIPPCHWWSEGAHGVARALRATVYPDPIAMAASWDPPLLNKVANATADEFRAKYSLRPSRRYYGLMVWSPTINMARDPRWGRCEETYGEDPWLTSRLAVAFCQGLQGDDPKYLKTVATPKHFAMHSQETGRTNTSFNASERVLHEYYLPAFEACFKEAGALSTMTAHNGINGVPAASNSWLLTDLLRNDWGFKGAVVTDYRELEYLYQGHRVANSLPEAAALALNSGVDIISEDTIDVQSMVLQAVRSGLLKVDVLDRAVTRAEYVKLRLGMMDPPEMVPFSKTPMSVVGSKEHINLALQMAREGIVVLQNGDAPKGTGLSKLLPLDLRRVNSVAILGEYANQTQLGTYIAGPDRGTTTSAYTGGPCLSPAVALENALGDRVIVRRPSYSDLTASIKAATDSDVAIVVVGLDNDIENEGVDRSMLTLPQAQITFVQRIVRANPSTIVVLQGGSPIALGWIKDNVPAIVMMWYAGEQGGPALADILLGTANPAGRLPITFYTSIADLPALSDYEISHGRTYMYLKKKPEFPFGHGLSYTTFKYASLRQAGLPGGATSGPGASGPPVMAAGSEPALGFSVDVTNTGTLDGDEVVQLYVSKPQSSISRPIEQLRAFARVTIPKGATKTVTLKVLVKDLAYWDSPNHKYVVEPGTYVAQAGASSADIREKLEFQVK